MPHVLTSQWLCVPDTTVWAVMNDFNWHVSGGHWFSPHRPLLSDVEETSLNNQPVTQIMQRPIRPAIPCTRERNLIFILLNLAESTLTEIRSESLFESLFLLRSDLPKSFLPLRCTDQHLFNPYPTAFPYGNGMVLHFYQQQESSTTKTVHKVINKGLKTYV